jgi:hypothetical protein
VSGSHDEIEAVLASAAQTLNVLARSVAGAPDETQLRGIWKCYVAIEKSIALIKLELEEQDVSAEQPGRFVDKKAYVVPDERQALNFASESLRLGLAILRTGEIQRGLKELRESRNYLRMLIRRRNLAQRKEHAGDSSTE